MAHMLIIKKDCLNATLRLRHQKTMLHVQFACEQISISTILRVARNQDELDTMVNRPLVSAHLLMKNALLTLLIANVNKL